VKMAKIKVNYKKCTNPEECLKCLNVCPTGVFMKAPVSKPKSPSTKPKAYKIVPIYNELCNTCGLCVNNCPLKAITIKM